MQVLANYINGKLIEPVDGNYLENPEPATGNIYSKVPKSNERDVQKAVDAAKSAFHDWSQKSIEDRQEVLLEISNLIERELERLAIAESKDNGKPVSLAKSVDIPRAAANFKFFATAIEHFSTNAHEMRGQAINYTLRQPLGVVGTISPWNLPLYLFTWKIAPALAAGNTVVAKPSEVTPMTAFLLSDLCIEAGLPPGVLNIVHGLGKDVGEAITTHKEIEAISFTGGTETGSRIASVAAPEFKKLSLEMGGKNPVIIFNDGRGPGHDNWDKLIDTTIKSSFSNQGEICLCGSRIYIEESLYDDFKDEFVRRTEELKVGDPQDDRTDIGAIVSEAHFNKIMNYIDLAKREGGTILTGGKEVNVDDRCSDGNFIQPTIIEGLDHTCRTNQEEIFGPVVTLQPFKTEQEVLRYANSTKYGLAAVLWTENLSRAHRLAPKIDTGILWVNCWMLRDLRTPFGGVKSSGIGREGGFNALEFFTEPKNVCIEF